MNLKGILHKMLLYYFYSIFLVFFPEMNRTRQSGGLNYSSLNEEDVVVLYMTMTCISVLLMAARTQPHKCLIIMDF